MSAWKPYIQASSDGRDSNTDSDVKASRDGDADKRPNSEQVKMLCKM